MFEITAETKSKIEADRAALIAKIAKTWRDGLSYNDWLFDGHPIRGRVMIERFNNLEWDKAWIDLGPSIAGNLGPYWHVPLGDTVHRLYPKVLQSRWAGLILHVCHEVRRKAALSAEATR